VCTASPYCPLRCPRFVDKGCDKWVICTAREHDLDRLLRFYGGFGPIDRSMGILPATDQRRWSWIETLLAEGHNIIAKGDDWLVGHVAYTPAEDDRPGLAVCVHPKRQNRGVGTELCAQAASAMVDADRVAVEPVSYPQIELPGGNTLSTEIRRNRRHSATSDRELGFQLWITSDSTITQFL